MNKEPLLESVAEMKNFYWLSLSALVLLFDQLTKNAVVDKFQLYDVYPITGYFNLTHLHNPGAAFSFLGNAGGWQQFFFILVALVVILMMLYWMCRYQLNSRTLAGFSLLIGGAAGNLWDRISFGYVIDFLDFYILNWHWPAFNVADAAICIGAALLILDTFLGTQKK